MENIIEQLENELSNYGGYILIPADKRPTVTFSDGCDETKTTKVKSVVWVMEFYTNNEFFFRIKCLDEDDEMWDFEEYLDEEGQKALLAIVTKH